MLVLNPFTNDSRVHKEASTLGQAGYDVTVVALWKPGLALRENKIDYDVHRIKLFSQKLNNRLLSPPIKYLEFAIKVWILAGKDHFQLYHANDSNTLPAAWLASKRSKGNIIYDAHELETGRNFSSSIAYIYRLFWALPEKIFIKKAISRITVSPLIADELSRIYKIDKPNVIYNCPKKNFINKTNRLHEDLNLPNDSRILLYQGIVTSGRGIETFIDVVNKLDDVVGVVLGEGPEFEKYRKQILQAKNNHFFFPGKVSLDVLPIYTASAYLGILLTQDTCLNHRLTLPNKLFEYIQAGLPVVCSNLPALAQIVNQYRIGVLVDPEDPVMIAHNIRILLDNHKLYEEMRINTLSAAEIFTWENEGKKFLKLYNDLSH